MTIAPRQPWGKGRAAKQKRKRNKLACVITDLLLQHIDPDNVEMSCQLFPRGSLKKRRLRSMFSWCSDPKFLGRKFTKKLVESVTRKLCHAVHLHPPPGKKFQDLVKDQSARLTNLVKAAKKLEAGYHACA